MRRRARLRLATRQVQLVRLGSFCLVFTGSVPCLHWQRLRPANLPKKVGAASVSNYKGKKSRPRKLATARQFMLWLYRFDRIGSLGNTPQNSVPKIGKLRRHAPKLFNRAKRAATMTPIGGGQWRSLSLRKFWISSVLILATLSNALLTGSWRPIFLL